MVQQAAAPPLVRDEWVPMSYEEWLDWAPETAHGEWVDGKGIVFVPSREHQRLALLLFQLIARYVGMFNLGEVMAAPFPIRLWPGGPIREPDVFFVAEAHRDRWSSSQVRGGVDLAIEIISPESVERDTVDKVRDYAAAGVQEFLLIDPRLGHFRVRLLRRTGDGAYEEVVLDDQGRLQFETLPGFWLDHTWFNQQPLPGADRLLFQIAGQAYLDWIVTQATS